MEAVEQRGEGIRRQWDRESVASGGSGQRAKVRMQWDRESVAYGGSGTEGLRRYETV
jgi:hypothetical protein